MCMPCMRVNIEIRVRIERVEGNRDDARLERLHGGWFRVWPKDAWVDEAAKVLAFLVLLHAQSIRIACSRT